MAIFWSTYDSVPITYRHRKTGDRRRKSQNGFYTLRVQSRQVCTVEKSISPRIRSCRGVCIQINREVLHIALSKTCRDAGTVLQAEIDVNDFYSRCKSVFVPTWLMFSVLFDIVLFINSNSNINTHVLLCFIETARISASSDSPKKNLVLERWLSVVLASTTR